MVCWRGCETNTSTGKPQKKNGILENNEKSDTKKAKVLDTGASQSAADLKFV